MANKSWLQAWVEVLPDFTQFKQRATQSMTNILGPAGAAGGAAAGQSMNGGILAAVPKLAGPLLAAFAALGIGRLIGNAIGSGINYTIDAVGLASDLAESVNAVNVSFGEEIGAEVLRMSDKIANSLKVTRSQFNATAVRFSAFAKTIAGSDAAQVIEDISRRASDFASVFNLDVSEALELFQSGLAGETEPLRKYGVDLSAASVEAFAYASGIAAAGDELTEAQKVQARYESLLAQTIATQGDAAATSGELAGQQREFAVALEEAQTDFGAALLPIATELLHLANEEVIPQLKDFLTAYGPELAANLRDVLPDLKTFIGELADAAPILFDFAAATLPLLVQGMRDVVEILTGFPGWSEFLGIDQAFPNGLDGTVYDLPDRPVQDNPMDFFGGGGDGGGGGGGGTPQFVAYQNNYFQPGLSEGNVADLATARMQQMLREQNA